MVKIHSFNSFAKLYEAEGPSPGKGNPTGKTISELFGVSETPKSKLYDQTLNMILNTILNSYTSLIPFPTSPYDSKINADLTSVKSAPVDKKVEAFAKIMANVKAASANNKETGAQEAIDAWIAAGTKAAEALTAMLNQYKDQPEEQKHINDFVNGAIDSYTKGLGDAAKQNLLKSQVSDKLTKESYYYGGEIFEGVLQGKKGMIEDVSKQVTLVLAKLSSLANNPGMADEVKKYEEEVKKIAAQMGELLNKPNKEIEKDEIKKAAARLAEIPTLLDKSSEISLKQDTANKEAASILVQALGLVQAAKDKYQVYIESMEKTTAANTATYDKDKIGEVNPTVKKFQELVVDKFKNNKQISGLTYYKKMGTDGKYGPSTRTMVEIIKSGFDLKDTSGDVITPEVIDELTKQEPLKESRIYNFNTFSGTVYEAFDVGKAEAAAKKITSAPVTTGGGGGGSSTKETSGKIFRKGSTGPVVIAINRIVGQTSDEKNYTDDTVARVKEFQKLNGTRAVDGIVGEDTIRALYSTRTGALEQGEKRSKLNDPKAPRGEWAYKTIANYLSRKYEPAKVSDKVYSIAAQILKGALGSGTNEGRILKGIEEIKNIRDLNAVNAIIASTYKTSAGTRAIENLTSFVTFGLIWPANEVLKGLFRNAGLVGMMNTEYKNLQSLINGEFGSDDIGTVKSIANHLNDLGGGIKATFDINSDGSYKEDTFKIKGLSPLK